MTCLIADRCLYGVDKNPLAVEMAKLSLWLITLDKNRPFTFLDHALKCGDSLVGATEKMFLSWSHTITTPNASLFDEQNRQALAEARRLRRQLQSFEVKDVRDAEEKARLLAEAEEATARLKLGCDVIVGVELLDQLKKGGKEEALAQAQMAFTAGDPMTHPDAQRALRATRHHRAFHWEFEFPEVFEGGGFSAFVGNPPFLGGTKISTLHSIQYLYALQSIYPSFRNRADLCALFFLQGFNYLKKEGSLGLIATKTITEGDTLYAGLNHILKEGANIYRAEKSRSWPGQAMVLISIVHLYKGDFLGRKQLDNQGVSLINSSLEDRKSVTKPKTLITNNGKCFNGSKLDGIGFVIDKVEANKLIEHDPNNHDVIFPYLNGSDVNTNFDQSTHRSVIFFSNWDLKTASEYPSCLEIVRERVKPQRQKHKEKRTREHWWQFQRIRPELYEQLTALDSVLVQTRVSKYLAPVFVDTKQIFSDALVVIASQSKQIFSVLQSSIHEVWVRNQSSSLGTTLRYTSTTCFETYPFPKQTSRLGEVGNKYHLFRNNFMWENNQGLTTTYNQVNNPVEIDNDISQLRELHIEMDIAVAKAYGWGDLDLGHGFYDTPQGTRFTISEPARREILARLLHLNHQRHAEEVAAGLHEKKKKKSSRKKPTKPYTPKNDNQLKLDI